MSIALGTGAFISLVGSGYVLSTPDNPFAYLVLLVGLCDVAALGMLRTGTEHSKGTVWSGLFAQAVGDPSVLAT